MLRQFRARAQLSQEALAERVGMHRHTIRAWERGASLPRSRPSIQALAEALWLSAAEAEALLRAGCFSLSAPPSNGPAGRTADGPGAARSRMPLPFTLLATKLSAPLGRMHLVTRPRLLHRMHAAIRGPLTLLAAPAGWGKTTLVTAWSAEADRGAWPLAWVTLDATDNDPLHFWTYVFTALNTLLPGVGETALAQMYAAAPTPIEEVLANLLNAVSELHTQTVLVLDDYHIIEAEGIHDALTYLTEYLPANLHLVIASRSNPPLPLARLRARGTLAELRAPDLRFTVEETATFLTEVMGLPLSAEQVTALQLRTEGWIAGLQLAALSLHGRDDVAGFIAAFTGNHRYVLDYLFEEVLARQPAAVQDFLVQTCILERLCGPVCDAVREQDDSHAKLEYLEQHNLFLVALDDERQWYRYHALFAEVLHSRLQQIQPILEPELHRRACDWFEQHQLFDEAIAHALAVPDIERAARLITQHGWLLGSLSHFHGLLEWVDKLPEMFVRSQPALCVTHALMLMLSHRLDRAAARIQDAERCLEKELPAEQRRTVLCLIAASRGCLARLLGDHERGVPLAQQALALLPDGEETLIRYLVYPTTRLTTASAYLVDGEMTPATEHAVMATVASMRDKGVFAAARSISNLARLQLLQGRLRQAASTIEEVRYLASGHDGLQALLNGADYCLLLGELLREWNQLDQAEELLAPAMDVDQGEVTVEAEMILRGYMALARVQQARGRSAQALQTVEAFMRLGQHRGFASALLARGAAVRAQLALAHGDLPAAIRWVEASDVSASEELSYSREHVYFVLARVRIAQGRDQPTASYLSEALSVLERLGADAEAKGRTRSVLEALVLRALAFQVQGDSTEAVAVLAQALVLAEPEGYIRLFLDEGAPMIALLRLAQQHALAPHAYIATLLTAAREASAPTAAGTSGTPSGVARDPSSPSSSFLRSSPPSPLLGALTRREREVLRLLVDGASNREIAEQLVLSVNTVKKHMWNICVKLGVQSRTQAIAQARTRDLL
jgi:LuxR family maltose regulon positive regulatory protein